MAFIDKQEVIRYLGGSAASLDDKTSRDIDAVICECEKSAVPRVVYKEFDIDDRFVIKNSEFEFLGKDIKKHLQGAERVILMAATIGFEIEKKISLYEVTSLSRSVILDACASAYIEAVCDSTEEKIRQEKKDEGKFLTGRFSPGYGDFPMSMQKGIAALLVADKKIGLKVSGSSILMPRKSVTAVMGVTHGADEKTALSCENCKMAERCEFRKNGKRCIY